MNKVKLSSIAVLAFASVATSSAWADVTWPSVTPATATSSASGSYTSVSGTKTSSANLSESDAGGFVNVAASKWDNGFAASAEATGGSLKAFAATTYTPAVSGWSYSNSNASASFSDFITFSGGSGASTGTFLTSLAGMLSGGKTVYAGYSLTASLCDTGSGSCWDSQSLINDSRSLSGKSKLTIDDKYESDFDFVFGKTYQLNTSFTANASNGGTADFSDTVHLSFNVGKGVALTSASGYQYNVAAVPEPEAFAMMLSGLGMIGFVARRRRKM